MGGHSAPRTYRPSTGMAGSEMIHAITKLTKKLSKQNPDSLKILFGTKLHKVILDSEGKVIGAKLANQSDENGYTLKTHNLILATGGFAADLKEGSLLQKYRPDLIKFQTTNGPFATGDGHKVAIAAGAAAVDMNQVQVSFIIYLSL